MWPWCLSIAWNSQWVTSLYDYIIAKEVFMLSEFKVWNLLPSSLGFSISCPSICLSSNLPASSTLIWFRDIQSLTKAPLWVPPQARFPGNQGRGCGEEEGEEGCSLWPLVSIRVFLYLLPWPCFSFSILNGDGWLFSRLDCTYYISHIHPLINYVKNAYYTPHAMLEIEDWVK